MQATPIKNTRSDALDTLRGFALVWMAIFHFSFDLSNFRLINADFHADPVWTLQRTCILSLFLLCAGAGQALATSQGQSWSKFWRRWAQIAGCAVLVSIGSAVMFPNSYIYFGVLHGMAVMLILARLSAPLKQALWPLGLLAMCLPQVVGHVFFDAKLTNWIGLVTHKPITEDYVPILPWLGVMWWGLAGMQWWLARQAKNAVSSGRSSDNINVMRVPHLIKLGLARLGRHSLTFYMLHQPLLIGGLTAWMTLTGRPIS
ncbi:MAG: heparan-alpha-glucosaminide N-acetyltransferase [Aquabacterium sp.]|nr:heparan-alpha-glucosaminide N-acetyltransferase [Aquabacterium sp.]